MRLEDDKEFLSCDYCRNIYFPEKNDDGVRVLGEAALACPVCAVPLAHAALAGVRMIYCSRCRGMLIPMDAFVALIEMLRAQGKGPATIPKSPDAKGLERHIDCPQCHRRMDTHYYGGPGNIIIDDCSPCHLNWLDSGELGRIIRAPDRNYDDGTVAW
jgi:Zn-finger nucleic acid-binding protein